MPATPSPSSTSPSSSPSSTDGNQTPEVAQARQDLATRLNLPETNIEVVEAKAIVWPDSSLGCPQPGMMYAQVLQDGLLIVLRANQKLYEYHSGGNQPPFLCEKPPVTESQTLTPSTAAQITQANTITVELPTNPGVVQAMKDLARRVSVSLSQITVVQAEPVTWPDAGLGCPQPGIGYKQVQVDGMLIVLEANGQRFEYHSGGNRPPILCEKK